MAIVYLISAEALRDEMTINTDVDAKTVSSSILEAQKVQLRQVLGTSLYRHMLELVENGTITDTSNSDYKTLLDDYIIPYLMFASMVRLVPHLNAQLTDKGLQSRNGEFSQPVSRGNAKMIVGQYKNDAEYMSEILIKYLCEYSNKFPEYDSTLRGEDMKGHKKPYFNGIQFG